MKTFYQNVINDKNKELKWYNSNFCYLTTIIFVGVLMLCFYMFNDKIGALATKNDIWNMYLPTFYHSDIVHVSFNAIMFALLSILLERHFGSFTYLLMLVAIIPLSNMAHYAAKGLLSASHIALWTGCGESCVNCFLLGLYIVVAIAYFKQYILSFKAFLTFIPLALVLFFFSVDSSVISTPKEFFANPKIQFLHALTTNQTGHLAPLIVGVVVSILIYVIVLTNKFLNNNK